VINPRNEFYNLAQISMSAARMCITANKAVSTPEEGLGTCTCNLGYKLNSDQRTCTG
jgi:hypothetical protein